MPGIKLDAVRCKVALRRKHRQMAHEKPSRWSHNAGGRYSQCSFCMKLSVPPKSGRWKQKIAIHGGCWSQVLLYFTLSRSSPIGVHILIEVILTTMKRHDLFFFFVSPNLHCIGKTIKWDMDWPYSGLNSYRVQHNYTFQNRSHWHLYVIARVKKKRVEIE